jgi:hypothetical protein
LNTPKEALAGKATIDWYSSMTTSIVVDLEEGRVTGIWQATSNQIPNIVAVGDTADDAFAHFIGKAWCQMADSEALDITFRANLIGPRSDKA